MVEVPDDLAGPLARLVQRGLREIVRNNGAASLSPRLVAVLTELAAADLRAMDSAESSAGGSVVVESVSLLSVGQASERLECSTRWTRHLAASGRLRGATQVGREWVIPLEGLEDFRRGGAA